MLRSLSKNSRRNLDIPKSSVFESGMEALQEGLYEQAVAYFSSALEEQSQINLPKLFELFKSYVQNRNEAVVEILGELLMEAKRHDPDFLNSMGNNARRQFKYKRANDFYRQALRIDRSHRNAFFNLAASLAKVERYNHDVKNLLRSLNSLSNYLLPEYLNDPDMVDKIIDQIHTRRNQQVERIQSWLMAKEEKLAQGDTEAVKHLIHRIEAEERNRHEPTYDAICHEIRQSFKTNWMRTTVEQSQTAFQENLFNLGLFALSNKDKELATDCFAKLKKPNAPINTWIC